MTDKVTCGLCGELMPDGEDARAFLLRAADGKHRIVSSGDLIEFQIAEARVEKTFFVDEQTGLGFALLPWELTTDKDCAREKALKERVKSRAASIAGTLMQPV